MSLFQIPRQQAFQPCHTVLFFLIPRLLFAHQILFVFIPCLRVVPLNLLLAQRPAFHEQLTGLATREEFRQQKVRPLAMRLLDESHQCRPLLCFAIRFIWWNQPRLERKLLPSVLDFLCRRNCGQWPPKSHEPVETAILFVDLRLSLLNTFLTFHLSDTRVEFSKR